MMDFQNDSSSSDSESGSEEEGTSHDGDLGGQQDEMNKDGAEDGSNSEPEVVVPVPVPTTNLDREDGSDNQTSGATAVMASTSHKVNRFLEDDSDLEDQKETNDDIIKIASDMKRRLSSEDEGESEQETLTTKKRRIDSDEEGGDGEGEGKGGDGGDSDGDTPSNHEKSGIGEESEGEEGSEVKNDGTARESIEGSGEEEEEGEEEGALQLQVEETELLEEEGEGRGEERGRGGGEEQGSDDELDDRGISDWDLMMQRRKDAMARSRRKKKRDGDLTVNDDHIMALIQQMRRATGEDRQLNLAHKAATKKIQLLPTVMGHLKKADLQTTFIECGILTALAEWLTPLPDQSLPHLKIREAILETLKSFPIPDGSILKSSKIGKAVMLVYRHPKESRKNREKAGKIINEWARPIFGLASDFKSMTRDEREERDYANLSQEARQRISTGDKGPSQDDDTEPPQKPGDKGWIGRARVPMPSTKGYVVRPKWNVEFDFKKSIVGKKTLNRYEKHVRKKKQEKMQSKTTHAVPLSVEGRKMPL